MALQNAKPKPAKHRIFAWRMAVLHSRLSPVARLVAVRLAEYSNAKLSKAVWPKISTLADELHLGHRTVARALRELRRAGFIQGKRTRGATRYFLAFPGMTLDVRQNAADMPREARRAASDGTSDMPPVAYGTCQQNHAQKEHSQPTPAPTPTQGGVSCSACGADTVRRANKMGVGFWGCSRYPECRATRPLDAEPKPPTCWWCAKPLLDNSIDGLHPECWERKCKANEALKREREHCFACGTPLSQTAIADGHRRCEPCSQIQIPHWRDTVSPRAADAPKVEPYRRILDSIQDAGLTDNLIAACGGTLKDRVQVVRKGRALLLHCGHPVPDGAADAPAEIESDDECPDCGECHDDAHEPSPNGPDIGDIECPARRQSEPTVHTPSPATAPGSGHN